jgi:predicted nucleic acid-binding protein
VTLYLDSSHLVKLYVDEDGSAVVRELVARADVVVTSVLAYPETRAALARRRRERRSTPRETARAVRQLEADWARLMTVPLDDDIRVAAGRLVEAHDLRGADAVHLAAFEALVARTDNDVEFSCADGRLVRAAKRLG